jgi:hypothetical protein
MRRIGFFAFAIPFFAGLTFCDPSDLLTGKTGSFCFKVSWGIRLMPSQSKKDHIKIFDKMPFLPVFMERRCADSWPLFS